MGSPMIGNSRVAPLRWFTLIVALLGFWPSVFGHTFRSTLDDRQDEPRGILGVVVDRVGGRDVGLGRFAGDQPAGVGVAAEAGKVAASDLQADPVTGKENVGRRPHV